jgi:hypothetical protein
MESRASIIFLTILTVVYMLIMIFIGVVIAYREWRLIVINVVVSLLYGIIIYLVASQPEKYVEKCKSWIGL